MERHTNRSTIVSWIGDDIQVYVMTDLSTEQTVIPITVWWWQKLVSDWQ
jgi:hypothetical protein